MDVPGIEGKTFLLTDEPLLTAREYVDEVAAASATRIDAPPTPIWRFFALDVAKEAVKHLIRHPNRRVPSYRDWDCRAHRARYDSSETRDVLGWKPAGTREAMVERRHRRRRAPLLPLIERQRTRSRSRRHGTGRAEVATARSRRLPRQSVPEGQPHLHPPRDPGARAAGRRGDALRAARLGRRRRRRATIAASGRARATCCAGGCRCSLARAVARRCCARRVASCARARARAAHGARAPTGRWPYHLVYLAEACRLLRVAARRRAHRTCTRTSAPTPPRSRCWSRELGGPPYSFTVHGPDEFDAPAVAAASREKIAARGVRRRDQLVRAQPALSLDRRTTHWPKVQVVHCGLDAAFHAGACEPSPASARGWSASAGCASRRASCSCSRPCSSWSPAVVALELVLAGDGEMRAEIEALIDALGLRDRVRITGWIDGDAGARRDPRRARAGAAELRRRPAGRDHGGDGAGPPGDQHVRRRHPRAGSATARTAGSFPRATSRRSPTRSKHACATPRRVLARMGDGAHDARRWRAIRSTSKPRKLVDAVSRAAVRAAALP